jgi:hexokinase
MASQFLKSIFNTRSTKIVVTAAVVSTASTYLIDYGETEKSRTTILSSKNGYCHAESNAAPANPTASQQPPLAMPSVQKLYLEFHTPTELLENLATEMISEMEKGLQKDNCDIKMLPSFVCDLPTGQENGKFLALDLGGSNFRVLRFKVQDGDVTLEASKKAKIPKQLMSKTSSGVDMFQFIADTVAQLPASLDDDGADVKLPLGFTFSFPCQQYKLNAGTLLHWTKGFETSGVVGENVVTLLQNAFVTNNINVEVSALVNDTVGTLVAHVIEAPDTVLGVILGTGCNACYVEDINNVSKWADRPTDKSNVIINMEWGGFNSKNVPGLYNKFDEIIDINEDFGSQRFEKQISGRYLGELTRLACLHLFQKEQLLFQNTLNGRSGAENEELAQLIQSVFGKPHHFLTPMMSKIQSGEANNSSKNPWLRAAAKVGPDLHGDYTEAMCEAYLIQEGVQQEDIKYHLNFWKLWSALDIYDRQVIYEVCDMVSTRAARLSAAAIGAVVRKIHKEDSCTVAIDGSVFEHYPYFKENMEIALLEMLGETKQVKLELSPDGSGKGAALIAAIANC